MKVLERRITTNGYGCQCCMVNHENTDWIDESEMLDMEDLLDLIDKNWSNLSDPHTAGLMYEKDGEVFYGFESDIYRKGEDNRIVFGDKKLLYRTARERNEAERMSREEILDEFEKWMREWVKNPEGIKI